MGGFQRILHVLNSMAHGHFQINLCQLLHKQVAVLGIHDGLDACAEHLDIILLQYTALVQLRTAV